MAIVVLVIVVGVVAALAVIGASNALLPPFRDEDDDTLREYGPVAIAYLASIVSGTLVFIAGWRWLDRG